MNRIIAAVMAIIVVVVGGAVIYRKQKKWHPTPCAIEMLCDTVGVHIILTLDLRQHRTIPA